jgi:hypothetical protein
LIGVLMLAAVQLHAQDRQIQVMQQTPAGAESRPESRVVLGNASCPTGQRLEHRVGFESFDCVGCKLRRDPETGIAYLEFSKYPVVTGLGSAGRIRDKDQIVAVNNVSLLTPTGAKLLATLPVGQEVTFSLIRSKNRITTRVTPEYLCKPPVNGLPSRPQSFTGTMTADMVLSAKVEGMLSELNKQPRGWFGFALSCDSCALLRNSSFAVQNTLITSEALALSPRIVEVDSGGPAWMAGLKAGDILHYIGGALFVSDQGQTRFMATNPGDTVMIGFQRGSSRMTTRLVASQPRAQNAVSTQVKGLALSLTNLAHGSSIDVSGADVTLIEDPRTRQLTITGDGLKIVLRLPPR